MEVSNEDAPQSAHDRETGKEVRPTREPWIRRRWTWLVLGGLAAAVLVIVAIITMRSSGPEGGESIRTSGDHSPGSEVTLYVEGRDSVMVAVDEKALEELVSTISTRGDAQTLIQSGRVFTVPNKTRVRIIEASFAKLRVRIIEGEKIMFEVWVPERWVR